MPLRATKQAEAELDDEVLAAMVVQDPIRPGLERGRLADYEIPVWAIIGHLQAQARADIGERVDQSAIAQTALDYHVPERAVMAAIAYYRRHRILIDGLLARNAAAAS
jgi:hypothetical protein